MRNYLDYSIEERKIMAACGLFDKVPSIKNKSRRSYEKEKWSESQHAISCNKQKKKCYNTLRESA